MYICRNAFQAQMFVYLIWTHARNLIRENEKTAYSFVGSGFETRKYLRL